MSNKNKKPFFSILIPVYNTEKYLGECLASVEAQSFRDFEVVITNDGSTDGSGDICDQYRMEHPEYVKVIHKKNDGLLRARRDGIKIAEGRYCIFLDSDDFWTEDCLTVLSTRMKELDYPDLLIFRFRYYNNGTIRECKFKGFTDGSVFEENKAELYNTILDGSELNTSAVKVMSTELLKKDPTDFWAYPNKQAGEDILHTLFLFTKARRIGYIRNVLLNYRTNDEGISQNTSIKKMATQSRKHVYQAIEAYLPLWGMNTNDCRQRLAARNINGALYYFDKYYMAAKSLDDKKAVLTYDWASHIISDWWKAMDNNPYVSLSTKKMWKMIKQKKYVFIELYYLKKKIYKLLRHIKREIFSR